MMRVFRYLKYLFLIVVGFVLVLMAFANWDPVTVELAHSEIEQWTGIQYAVTAPLFLVILASIMLGILVGFVLEWLREHHYRVEAKVHKRSARQLEREVKSLKGTRDENRDEILALVDESSPAR